MRGSFTRSSLLCFIIGQIRKHEAIQESLALTRGRRDGENRGPPLQRWGALEPLAESAGNKSLLQQLRRKAFHARRHGYRDSTGGGGGIIVASDYGCLHSSGNDVDQGGDEQYAHNGYAECFAHNSLHPHPVLL
jgi:hypothetical protein